MTEPELQIEQRVSRLELAVKTLAEWSGANNAKTIEQILSGQAPEKPVTNASP